MADDVMRIALHYPWVEKLKFKDYLAEKDAHYNPSLDFTCIETRKSFGLTADFDEENKLEFSLWYTSPKKVKVLFGLLGEKEKKVVEDVWEISPEVSFNYLKHFVDGDYALVEKLFTE